jgi:hypothetical protein
MTENILYNQTASILLIENRQRKDIIIGAPHHTVGGIKNMPCPEHTDGDENTGFIARNIAERLKVHSIIACNYQIDPNKSLSTDYSNHIVRLGPKFLIEIHGHGAKKIDNYSIEISSGRKDRNEFSKQFANTVKDKFQYHEILKTFKISGNFHLIHFKATKTATIIDDRWTSIHIELPPSIRLDAESKLPLFIDYFNTFLTESIDELCK